MQAMVGPASAHQSRPLNRGKIWSLSLPVFVIEPMPVAVGGEVLSHGKPAVAPTAHPELPPHPDEPGLRDSVLVAELTQRVGPPSPGDNPPHPRPPQRRTPPLRHAQR